jgi:hypothetical protein
MLADIFYDWERVAFMINRQVKLMTESFNAPAARSCPEDAADCLSAVHAHLGGFGPAAECQKTLHVKDYRESDRILELRRIRLNSVFGGFRPRWNIHSVSK